MSSLVLRGTTVSGRSYPSPAGDWLTIGAGSGCDGGVPICVHCPPQAPLLNRRSAGPCVLKAQRSTIPESFTAVGVRGASAGEAMVASVTGPPSPPQERQRSCDCDSVSGSEEPPQAARSKRKRVVGLR